MNNACDCLSTYTDDKNNLCAFYLKAYRLNGLEEENGGGEGRGNHNDLDLSSDKRHDGL